MQFPKSSFFSLQNFAIYKKTYNISIPAFTLCGSVLGTGDIKMNKESVFQGALLRNEHRHVER